MKKDYKERLVAKAKAEAIGEAATDILQALRLEHLNNDGETVLIPVSKAESIVRQTRDKLGFAYSQIANKK